MTESEAIEYFYKQMENGNIKNDTMQLVYERAIEALEEVQQLHAIGTVSEFRELKKKATAKKPTDVRHFGEFGYIIGFCPTCKNGINSEFKYCCDCGQHLDWSEGKE